MDLFKGIGDFFGGLFGQKKKKEEQPQVQQPKASSAVSFNKPQGLNTNSSAFSNNPAKPATFGKSSADITGVNLPGIGGSQKTQEIKPIAPVKSAPQIKNPYAQEHSNLSKGVGQGVFEKEVLDSYNKPTQRPFESTKAFDNRRMAEAIVKNDVKQLERIRDDFEKKSFETGLFGTKQTPYFDKTNQLNNKLTDLAVKNNNQELLARQQAKTRHAVNLANNAYRHNNSGAVKAVRELPHTLNPASDIGLFGTKQQQKFSQVAKPLNTELEKYNNWVDSGDKQAGFQWNDAGDYLRFAQKLPSGMAGGVLDAPNKVGGAMTGKFVDKDGNVSDKNAIQRAAMLGDAYLSTAGLAHGASGKMMQAFGKGALDQTGKQAVKSGLWNGVKDFAKGVLTEGGEEMTQNLLGELGERGHFDDGTLNRTLEAGAMGMLGGVMMDGTGRVVSGARNAYSKNADKVSGNNNLKPINPYGVKNNYEYSDSIRNKLSPEQEAFFKDSKVRDENGELMRVYHGTNADFDVFDLNAQKNIGNNFGKGIYLTTDKEYAKGYAGSDGRVIEGYADIKKPLTLQGNLDDAIMEGVDADRKYYNTLLSQRGYNENVIKKQIANGSILPQDAIEIKQDARRKLLMDYGYDGIKVDNDTVVAFEPSQIKYTDNLNPTDSPDMRYKVQSETTQLTAKLDELKSRHQNLTGDEDLVFNIFKDEIQKNALGYFDPKTNKINLNDLTTDTLNHEIGHKIFSRVPMEQKADLINEIRSTFGDEALISKYGKDYGDDINILAEERLADGFNEYYQGKLNGEDSVRLGTRLGIPPKVLAYYDRMIEAIKSVLGATDELKKFYAEIETGKFAENHFPDVRNMVGGEAVPALKIDPGRALNTIKDFEDVLSGNKPLVKMATVSPELATRIYESTGILVKPGADYELVKNNAIHINNRHIHNKADPNPLTDSDIASLPYVLENPDTIKIGNKTRLGDRIRLERKINKDHIAVVEVIKKGNALNVVTYFNDSSSTLPNATMSPVDIRPEREQSTNLDDSIAQNANEVKYKRKTKKQQTLKEFLERNPDLKVRGFVDNVLKNDPNPPAEFIESIKGKTYSPRKNAELWRAAVEDVARDPAKAYQDVQTLNTDKAIARGIALAQYYKGQNMNAEAGAMYIDLAKKATEAGRQVQAFNLMKKSTPEGMMLSIQREIEQYNAKMEKEGKLNKVIAVDEQKVAKQLENLEKAYNMVNETKKEQRIRKIAISKAVDDIRADIPSSRADKALTLWKAGLLTAPTTHLRNLVGNTVNGLSEWSAGLTGSMIDAGVGLATGRRGVQASFGGGYLRGMGEGFGTAWDIVKTGVDTSSDAAAVGKFQDKKINWGNSKLGKLGKGYTETVFRALSAADKPFRQGVYEASITNQAKIIAKNEGLKGREKDARIKELIKKPTTAMAETANYEADMATFQQETALGNIAKKAKQAKGGKILDVIMPFTQVPSGVGSQLVNYSPLGIVKGLKQFGDLAKAGKSGHLDEATATALQRKASIQTGRGINGTLLLGAGAYLASQGILTGEPRSEDEKRQWEAEGKKPNSLKFGDVYIPLDKISPQMIALTAGARAQNEMKEGSSLGEAGANTLSSLVKSWSEQGYLTGISDTIDVAKGDMKFERWLGNQIGSLNPNIIKKVAAALDGNARETNSTVDNLMSGLPVLRQNLPQKYDIYGKEVGVNPLGVMLDPLGVSRERSSNLTKELDEIRSSDKDFDKIIPNKAPTSIKINGETRKLTAKEESEYQKLMGDYTAKYMTELLESKSFNEASQEDKVDLLEKVKTDVKRATEMAMFNKIGKQTGDNPKAIAQVMSGIGNVSPDWRTKEQQEDDLYEKPDSEYLKLKQQFDENKASGKFKTGMAELQASIKLKRAEVGKDTPKEFREAYGASKKEVEMMLNMISDPNERQAYINQILDYGDKLVAAGIEKKNKFRDKYGNVDFSSSSSGSSKKGKASHKARSVSALSGSGNNSNLMKLLNGTRDGDWGVVKKTNKITVRKNSPKTSKSSAVRFNKR